MSVTILSIDVGTQNLGIALLKAADEIDAVIGELRFTVEVATSMKVADTSMDNFNTIQSGTHALRAFLDAVVTSGSVSGEPDLVLIEKQMPYPIKMFVWAHSIAAWCMGRYPAALVRLVDPKWKLTFSQNVLFPRVTARYGSADQCGALTAKDLRSFRYIQDRIDNPGRKRTYYFNKKCVLWLCSQMMAGLTLDARNADTWASLPQVKKDDVADAITQALGYIYGIVRASSEPSSGMSRWIESRRAATFKMTAKTSRDHRRGQPDTAVRRKAKKRRKRSSPTNGIGGPRAGLLF